MIIALAKNLDLQIIAEGVEDEKQFKFLQKSGADIIQGFYLGKAMKYEDAIQLLKDYNINRTASLTRKR
jgi:EAL domain-containing protein (putative c-di-GMP-specific phosphodiesterase class I)